MGQTPANIGFDPLNELAAIDEWYEALCRGGLDSEPIRFLPTLCFAQVSLLRTCIQWVRCAP